MVCCKVMKILFVDLYFNVMDGLDIYIDDYLISELILEVMMVMLNYVCGMFFDVFEEEMVMFEKLENCDILVDDG